MKYIYFDNHLLRSLTSSEIVWNQLFAPFIKTFGRRFKIINSFYSLFEFIPFHEDLLEIPIELKNPYFDDLKELKKIRISTSKEGLKSWEGITKKEIALLDKNLLKCEAAIGDYIKPKIHSLKPIFKRLIKENKEYINSFQGAEDLYEKLFGSLISLFENDFSEFANQATMYWVWDVFCRINPLEFDVRIVRERQLGFWLSYWESGTTLPFAKIIDDLSSYLKMNFKSFLKQSEDQVDAEMLTYLILGYHGNPINFLTYPTKNINETKERNELALGSVDNIEKSLGKSLKKHPGKIYILDPKTHEFKEAYEPIFPLSL